MRLDQIPGVSFWTDFELDRRSPAAGGSDGFGYLELADWYAAYMVAEQAGEKLPH